MSVGKLTKVDREFTVTICDNGFMLSVSGRTENDDWSNVKLICATLNDLIDNIKDVEATPVVD